MSVKRLPSSAAIIFALLVTVIPLLWMVETSLKSNVEILQGQTLFPRHLTLSNYQRLFTERAFGTFLLNSTIVTTVSVGISLVLGSIAAYSIARFRLWHGIERQIGLVLLVSRIVPLVVIVIPIYLLILKLDLIDTLPGLIIVYTAFNVSFVVWMMESFFREIPVDLEEAAMVDGDSRLTAFRRIVLPLAMPGVVATAIFAVIVTFNEFLVALVLTSTPNAMTVPRGTSTLIGRTNIDWGAMSSAGVLAALPVVIFALIVQRHLVRGLTMGAVK